MTTPEGITKRNIKKVLDIRKPMVFYDMPVPSGYGRSTLDFIGCARGTYFAIEAKAWDTARTPSPRQEGIMLDMRDAGGHVFVVSDQDGLDKFMVWLDFVIGV